MEGLGGWGGSFNLKDQFLSGAVILHVTTGNEQEPGHEGVRPAFQIGGTVGSGQSRRGPAAQARAAQV